MPTARDQQKSVFAIDGEDLERARSALQEVEDIHSYLRRAEKDISELCELHQQLHAMVHRPRHDLIVGCRGCIVFSRRLSGSGCDCGQVEAQGEHMDRIEAWVAEDLQAVTAGVKELELANKHKRARRKKMVMLVCCLMVGLFFVIWPVLGWLPD